MTESWRQQTFAKNYKVLIAHGVSRAEAGRLAALSVRKDGSK